MHVGSLSSRWRRPAIAAVLLLVFLSYTPTAIDDWREARGYEYEWVAWSLAQGHGYSFDGGTAWLGPYGPPSEYSRTAWIEPIQTSIMALCFHSFDENGRLVLVLLNALWLTLTALTVFLIVERLAGSISALTSAILFGALSSYEGSPLLYIGNAALAGFIISSIALVMIHVMERPSLSACVVLGVVLGVGALTHAGTLLAIPLAYCVIVFAVGCRRRESWRYAGVAVLVAGLMLAPWTVRNLSVFGELVPVRTGSGFNAYIGNPGLGRTIEPGLRDGDTQSPPLWTAKDPREALWKLKDLNLDRALRWHSLSTIQENSSDGYSEYNEAQRDRVFRERALEFVGEEFWLAVRMAIWKVIAFYGYWGWPFRVITVMAFLGLLLRVRDARAAAIVLLLAAYTLPYAVSLPLYYRYRFPVEPLLVVMSGLLLGSTIDLVNRSLRSHWR